MVFLIFESVLFEKKRVLAVIILVECNRIMGSIQFFNDKILREVFRGNRDHLSPKTLPEVPHMGNLSFCGGGKGGMPHHLPIGGIFHYGGPYRFHLALDFLGFCRHIISPVKKDSG
jgi:hypothetical protein